MPASPLRVWDSHDDSIERNDVMPGPMCSCQCKICRVPGSSHCRAHPGCCVPVATSRGFAGRDERVVAGALRELKAGSGSHSPSVAEFERAMPGLVKVDACFL